ncbi:hypothetical protein SH611_05120 [Geminicoccaceae bacterium 1502E]|nr:hypothetical protein [Geminicoccaceae bacterium 1502E]
MRNLLLLAAALVLTSWPGAGALAGGGNDRKGRLGQEAREACRNEARGRGFDVQEVRDTDRRGGGKVRVELALRRDGDAYRATCSYDRDRRRADLSVDRRDSRKGKARRGRKPEGQGGRDFRSACAEAAARQGFEVQQFGSIGTKGGRRVMSMVLWKEAPYRYRCTMQNNGDIRLDRD